jgi:NAD(P)-dependent dehydrogenase (short-subunit alcohol dehydrogenase family)
MRVVIVGAGKVGFNIAQMLSMEGHDVVIIEKNEERLQIVEDHLDIQTICGSGSNCGVLEEAGIRESRLFISVTEADELNMVACALAKQYGVPKTIARIRNPEYVESDRHVSLSKMGIDLIINPERVTARKIRLAPTPNCESRATKKTMIPIPPSQCVRLLQKRIPLGSPSTFEKILAPVVVNPETVSKKASGKLLHTPDSR